MHLSKNIILFFTIFLILSGCKSGKLPGADARKVSYDARERVKKNIEEGKGFRLGDMVGVKGRGGDFEFASSNELWRASLDVIDFMPLASANYSGGMIITDWYNDSANTNDSIKLTIRFLSNEVRSDALIIKIFYRTCKEINKCIVSEKTGPLAKELKKEILKIAATYKKDTEEKNFRPYKGFDMQK
tara:strand:+ start:152 stop:712 length:561 start_codon:yes stop_codon:yes gene_type:complete